MLISSFLPSGRLKESAPSRVVNVSSFRYKKGREIDLEDLNMKNSYHPGKPYWTSKLCNVLFTRELADKMAGTGGLHFLFNISSHMFIYLFYYQGPFGIN